MHAVIVKVTIEDQESATQQLREQVVPRVSQAPGFVAGYWTRTDNSGLGMTIWESEGDAQSMSDQVRAMAPGGVAIDEIELREVVAHA